MKVSTTRLITISNIGHNFALKPKNFNCDEVSSYIKKSEIVQKIGQNADQSKSKAIRVGFFYIRILRKEKFGSHSKEFLTACEAEELK